MEIIELDDHPFYVAVQYHPEYLSRPLRPSPPYLGLILAATGKLQTFITKVWSVMFNLIMINVFKVDEIIVHVNNYLQGSQFDARTC